MFCKITDVLNFPKKSWNILCGLNIAKKSHSVEMG